MDWLERRVEEEEDEEIAPTREGDEKDRRRWKRRMKSGEEMCGGIGRIGKRQLTL